MPAPFLFEKDANVINDTKKGVPYTCDTPSFIHLKICSAY